MIKTNLTKLAALLAIVLFYQCSGSKAVLITPGDAELAAAQKRWPVATKQTLVDGYTIFTGRCTKCHGPKNIAKRSEKEWMVAIDKMAPKAKLTTDEKTVLTQYILAKHDVLTAPGQK